MPADRQQLIDVIFTSLVFVSVLTLWLVGAIIWLSRRSTRNRQIEQRLGLGEATDGGERVLKIWKDGQEATTRVRASATPTRLDRLEQLLRLAGWLAPVQTLFMALSGGAAVIFVSVLVITGSAVMGFAAVVGGVFLLRVVLLRRAEQQMKKFEFQLIEALELAARSLRAGHPLVGAFQLVAQEIDDPVGTIFAEICQRQALGDSLEQSLLKAARLAGSDDMNLFATSVIIQLRSGGNLADLIQRLTAVIRDRLRLSRRVRVLTAQVQMSKRVLASLPFVMFFVLNLINADYIRPIYVEPIGQLMLVGALVSTLLGIRVMNRMSILRY